MHITFYRLSALTLLEKAPAQLFSCEICKVFNNIFLIEQICATASELP